MTRIEQWRVLPDRAGKKHLVGGQLSRTGPHKHFLIADAPDNIAAELRLAWKSKKHTYVDFSEKPLGKNRYKIIITRVSNVK